MKSLSFYGTIFGELNLKIPYEIPLENVKNGYCMIDNLN